MHEQYFTIKIHTENVSLNVSCLVFVQYLLTFYFTDPVEDLLLTEPDGPFISTESLREVAERFYS